MHVFNIYIYIYIYLYHTYTYIYISIDIFVSYKFSDVHLTFQMGVWLFEAAGLPRGSQGIAGPSGARPHGGHQI